jgi:hypothetical protein
MALMQLRDNIINLLMVLILTGIFTIMSYFMISTVREPYRTVSVTVLNPVLKAGEPLKMKFVTERNRFCQTTVAQFFVDLESNEVVYRGRVPSGFTDLGTQYPSLTLPLPFTPIPGRKYAYRPIVESDCGFSSFAHRSPDAVFEVSP